MTTISNSSPIPSVQEADDLLKALELEIPRDSSVLKISKILISTIKLLQEDQMHNLSKSDPVIRSQISGRIVSAMKDLGTLILKNKELDKGQNVEADLMRNATLELMMSYVDEVLKQIGLDSEQKQLFYTALTTRVSKFEVEVMKKVQDMRKATKTGE